MMGMVVGFGGLVALFVPTLFEGVGASLWGLAATTGAGVSYGIAFVYARQRLPQLPPLVGPAAQLVMASVWLLPITLVVDQPYTLPAPSWPVIASLLLVTVC